MPALRIIGALVAALGVLMAAFPGLFGSLTGGPEPAADTFAAIERRVRGGMVLGVGLVLLTWTGQRPWSTVIASIIFYFVFGALAMRILGLVVDGSDHRQWMWVAGEGLVIAVAAVWLWRTGAAG